MTDTTRCSEHGAHPADRSCTECAQERALVRARGERREALPLHVVREGSHLAGYRACMAVLVAEGMK